MERRYNGIIRDAAAEFGVEHALIKAVIWQESRFDEKAVGQAGEIGLMQLMELAAFEWPTNTACTTSSMHTFSIRAPTS